MNETVFSELLNLYEARKESGLVFVNPNLFRIWPTKKKEGLPSPLKNSLISMN